MLADLNCKNNFFCKNLQIALKKGLRVSVGKYFNVDIYLSRGSTARRLTCKSFCELKNQMKNQNQNQNQMKSRMKNQMRRKIWHQLSAKPSSGSQQRSDL